MSFAFECWLKLKPKHLAIEALRISSHPRLLPRLADAVAKFDTELNKLTWRNSRVSKPSIWMLLQCGCYSWETVTTSTATSSRGNWRYLSIFEINFGDGNSTNSILCPLSPRQNFKINFAPVLRELLDISFDFIRFHNDEQKEST